MIINCQYPKTYKSVKAPRPTNVIKVAIDTVYSKSFGLNYGGHPRNSVSFMRSIQDAQQLDAISKLVPQLDSPSLPPEVTDSEAFQSVASRYGQSYSDFEYQLNKLAQIFEAKSKTGVEDVVKDDPTKIEDSDGDIIDRV